MKLSKILFIMILMFIFNYLSADETGNKILLLYQSKEGQTANENLSAWHLVPILSKMDFELEFLDINGSLPDPDKFDNVYAVIGWLSGNSRKNPLELVNWYEKILNNNIRLILMGAIGCWQDDDTKQYLPDNEVNKIFMKLGVIYKGLWTNQKNKIDVLYKNNDIYPQGFTLTENIDYFCFNPVNENLTTYLTISRKDINNSESVVAFSSDRGGYIFTNQYILRDNNFLVDLKNFIANCLFSANTEQRILVSGMNDNIISKMIDSFKLIRMNTIKVNFNLLTKYNIEKLKMYKTIILEGVDYNKVNPDFIQKLNLYTQNGGGLVIAGGNWNKNIYGLLGISEITTAKIYLSTNIFFKSKIFPFSDKLKLIVDNKDPVANIKLSKDTNPVIYGKLKDNLSENIPFVWEKINSNGKIVVWKNDVYSINDYRSIFMQSVLMSMNGHAQFFANVAVMFLDDFPLPSYNIVRNINPIPSKEDLDDTDFYLNYALPNVLNLLKKYKIPLSSYAIFSYDQDISPPFINGEYFIGKNNAFKRMFDKLNENGCEIGLHGYNHQSLSLKSEVTLKWQKQSYMEDSLRIAKEDFNNLMGYEYKPFSYVSPMNVIDDTGIKALTNIFPSIKVISTVFKKDEDSYETSMDFGLIQGTDILKLPRTTFGYQFNETFIYDLNYGLWDYGAWTHFIHLDDSYDSSRNKGILWNNLIKEFESQIGYVQKSFPFLRYYLARDAYYTLLDYEETDFKFYSNKKNKEIDIRIFSNNSKSEKFIMVRLPDNSNLKRIENGNLVYIFPDKEFLIVKTTAAMTKIFYE